MLTLTVALVGCALKGPATSPGLLEHGEMDRLVSVARLQERHGDMAQAQKLYRAVLSNDPANLTARHRLGVTAGKAGDVDAAIGHLSAAEQLNPEDSTVKSDLGYTFFLQGDHTRAIAKLQEAFRLDPKNQSAANNLAIVLAEEQRFAESIDVFRKVGSDAEAYANIGYLQTRMGKIDDSRESFHRALELDNTLRPAGEAIVQLAQHAERVAKRRATPVEPEQLATRRVKVEPTRSVEPPRAKIKPREAIASQLVKVVSKKSAQAELAKQETMKRAKTSASGPKPPDSSATAKAEPKRSVKLRFVSQEPKKPTNSQRVAPKHSNSSRFANTEPRQPAKIRLAKQERTKQTNSRAVEQKSAASPRLAKVGLKPTVRPQTRSHVPLKYPAPKPLAPIVSVRQARSVQRKLPAGKFRVQQAEATVRIASDKPSQKTTAAQKPSRRLQNHAVLEPLQRNKTHAVQAHSPLIKLATFVEPIGTVETRPTTIR